MGAGPFNPLSSPQWHRVADWRPRLPDQVQVTRQWVRGQRWHVLHAPSGGPGCRLDPLAYAVAGRLDGQRTLQDVWALLDRHAADTQGESPSQDEVIAVLTALQEHGLLAFEHMPDGPPTLAGSSGAPPHTDEAEPAPTRANSLMAWRVPLLDPSRLLEALAPLGRLVFSPIGALLWALLILSLLSGLVLHGTALLAHAQTWLSTPRYLLLATLAYPVIKLIHELAHGMAVRRWGGQVHEAGITLMLLMPIPYVDASAAHGFARAWQRSMVSAAGILAELGLAAVALWVWSISTPGLAQDLGFIVWFIAGVSTLLFNANPLQRLDGYHLMTDAMALPNLAPRSRQWWLHGVRRWLSGPDHDASLAADAPIPANGERPWLLAYAPLAWMYQLALWGGLTWWVGSVSAVLGVVVGALASWQLLLAPAGRLARMAWQSVLWSGHGSARSRTLRRVALVMGLPLLAMFLPWPDARLAQGVVWAPDQALLRPEVDGFVQQVHHHEGTLVREGDLIITLDNPRLRAEHQQAQARLAQAEQNQFSHIGVDSGKAGQAGDEVERLGERLAYLEAQLGQLQVRAHRQGQLVLPLEQDLPGRYIRRGELLGHVMPPGERPILRVAISEQAMRDMGMPLREVSARPADLRGHMLKASVLRDGGGAGLQLPSAALSREMGGSVATDPADQAHLRTLRPIVLMDVRLDEQPVPGVWPLGGRGWVRFDQGWSPPVAQIWRWARHRMAERFSASR